jgi:glucosylglycerate phosphorylase
MNQDDPISRIYKLLNFVYGEDLGALTADELLNKLERFKLEFQPLSPPTLSEKDTILITYADQFQEEGIKPLKSLERFCAQNLQGIISTVHVLPFFPYTSDDGFAVTNYLEVNPSFGGWEDIQEIGSQFRLMIDVVVNHCSSEHPWFLSFLTGDQAYKDYFIVVEPDVDLSAVVRPRALPLLTPFNTSEGVKPVWTTFSSDQVDLNFASPKVMLEMVEVLLHYIHEGAQMIRLDAIAFLWKEIGTSCLHLPKTHAVVQLMRAILDDVAPYILLITETNVPHRENLSYFGKGTPEAQLVYNFALPPLVLDAIQTGNAEILTNWAGNLQLPNPGVTFLNFLASHDGIGLNPARGILPDSNINHLVERSLAQGGLVSYKNNPDGSTTPYELNINFFDALGETNQSLPIETQINRFIAAQGILLSLIGIPGIYVHSLLGSRGWRDGVEMSKQNRTINRQKFDFQKITAELSIPTSLRGQIFSRYCQLLEIRAAQPHFSPFGRQEVIPITEQVLGIGRFSLLDELPIICLINVSPDHQQLPSQILKNYGNFQWIDLLSHELISPCQSTFTIRPYQVYWLKVLEEK